MVRWEGRGVHIKPLVYLIMKAIFSVVTSSAAMIRSPSFSRSVESSTTMKLPFPKNQKISQSPMGELYSLGGWNEDVLNASIVSSMLSKWRSTSPLTGINVLELAPFAK